LYLVKFFEWTTLGAICYRDMYFNYQNELFPRDLFCHRGFLVLKVFFSLICYVMLQVFQSE